MQINKMITNKICGVWSAAPTPFTDKMEIDTESVSRMVEHHIRIGVNGLFLLGTNGEGPWLTEKQKTELIRTVIKYNKKRMIISAQITDNSSLRMIDNAKRIADEGVDIAIMSSPYFFLRQQYDVMLKLYEDVLNRIEIPAGFYDRGKNASVNVPDKTLKSLYRNKKIIIVKDSSGDDNRMRIALNARKKNRDLKIFNGNEFNCVKYLLSGYDGLLLGGAVFNGFIASRIIKFIKDKQISKAEEMQKMMNKIMYAVYGGKKIRCWLSGEKYLLMKMGIFNTSKNIQDYPLTSSCKMNIEKIIKKYRKFLIPY